MSILFFTLCVLLFSFLAGLLGALTGLGGGVIIIPLLVLVFHINIHYAMGTSLISVIATSSGAAAAYLREGYTNIRIGIFLEVAAVIGAFIGALLIPFIPIHVLTLIFCCILFFSAAQTIKHREDHTLSNSSHPWSLKLKLDGSYPRKGESVSYRVQNVPTAFGLMGIGGALSGLLGIGAGTIKVLAMDQALRLPFKVSTTTSNFMIGITAAVSAGVYFAHGYIKPELTCPVLIGVILGSYVGAVILTHIHPYYLRITFSVVLCLLGLQMLYNAFFGATA